MFTDMTPTALHSFIWTM